jgi:hypothetical protein
VTESYEYPPGVDPDQYDLQTYLEGGARESLAAAERLDHRALEQGQLSPEDYRKTWGRK